MWLATPCSARKERPTWGTWDYIHCAPSWLNTLGYKTVPHTLLLYEVQYTEVLCIGYQHKMYYLCMHILCRLLPQRNKNETGVRVYIQDCPDYHRGPCMDSSGKCSVIWCALRSKLWLHLLEDYIPHDINQGFTKQWIVSLACTLTI